LGGKFLGWVPNATGNLSFSLIGGEGQPSFCDTINVVEKNRRLIVCSQKRNLSDNLLFKKIQLKSTGIHSFYFTLVARTGEYGIQNIGTLYGWIFIHLECPVGFPQLHTTETNIRLVQKQVQGSAEFAAAFRLHRDGRIALSVPQSYQEQTVEYGDQISLEGDDALRPLAAQCFYFFRDITHKHQHHSKHSDTLTSVWSSKDPTRWVRETLYELHRRAIVARRVRTPRGQEDAIGILAYASAFDRNIAAPFRKELIKKNLSDDIIPKYDTQSLKESLNATLEVKRRKRIQRNVVAAATPAFLGAMLAIANSIYRYPKDHIFPNDLKGWMDFISIYPMHAIIYAISLYDWAYPAIVMVGVIWILSFTGIYAPSEASYIKGPAQAFASWGKAGAVGIFGTISILVSALILFLLFVA
jgi:hypothetical protein